MHLRRALILFAVVLGLAAIVASFSRTDRDRGSPGQRDQTGALPGPAPAATAHVAFNAEARHEAMRRVPARRAAVITVSSKRSGLAAIGGLDSSPTEPDTPARFEVFQTRPGRFPVSFMPSGASRARRIGILSVVR